MQSRIRENFSYYRRNRSDCRKDAARYLGLLLVEAEEN
jgi:hypothetical protein